LGRAYLGLGREDDAVREAKTAIELFPLEEDYFDAPQLIVVLAEMYTAMGKYKEAIALLDKILAMPSLYSIPLIKAEPNFQPLIHQPEFAELERQYSLDQ
jgi:tetratricopeptide (TPR) repeat protein